MPARAVVVWFREVTCLLLSLFLVFRGRVPVRAMPVRDVVVRVATGVELRAVIRFVPVRAVVPRAVFVCVRIVVTVGGVRLMALWSRTAPLAMPTVAKIVAISI